MMRRIGVMRHRKHIQEALRRLKARRREQPLPVFLVGTQPDYAHRRSIGCMLRAAGEYRHLGIR